MEQEFEGKMTILREQFNEEKKKKADLDQELHKVRDELENIETRFPEEVRDLKAQIDFAKQQTTEYEKKTKDLQNELKDLRTKKWERHPVAQRSSIC